MEGQRPLGKVERLIRYMSATEILEYRQAQVLEIAKLQIRVTLVDTELKSRGK